MAEKEIRKVNWELLEEAIKQKGWSGRQLATALGQADNYIATSKSRGSMPLAKIKQAELILGLNDGELLEKQEELPDSEFEKKVMADLSEIKETLNLLMEVVGNLEAEDKPQAKPAFQQAKDLLNKMLSDIGSCKYDEYKSLLKTISVSPDIADEVIESSNCKTSVQGYGKTKCKWITRTRDGGIYRDSDIKVVGE